MTDSTEEPIRRTAIIWFVRALLTGLTGGAIMVLWIFANAMGHSGLYYWPLWYTGCAALLIASIFFVVSAHDAREWARRRLVFEATIYVFAVVCAVMGVWGLATGMSK